ncbi:MAG: hypothetical protein KDC85_16330 [Saprospiraceae bacterium]|nr:hypothetical protein [Saprospiraceae bacterium]
MEGVENVIPISLEKWRDYVDSDSELFWFEDTPLGQESLKVSKDNNLPLNIKTFAHMDFNKKYGHGNVQLNYLNQDGYRYISILHTRESLGRIEKYYQIAHSLEANLYKNKTLIDEKQLNKIREKYKSKGGKQAPKEE